MFVSWEPRSTLCNCDGAFVFGALWLDQVDGDGLQLQWLPPTVLPCIRTLEALARRPTVVQEESDNSHCVDFTETKWPRASQLCGSKADNNPCIDIKIEQKDRFVQQLAGQRECWPTHLCWHMPLGN